MVWFMLTVPATVNRRPPTRHGPRVRGQPRDALVVAQRDHPEGGRRRGGVAVPVGHRRARRHPLDLNQPGPHGHGRGQPVRRPAGQRGQARRSPRPAGPGRARRPAGSAWPGCWPGAAPRAGRRPARPGRPPRRRRPAGPRWTGGRACRRTRNATRGPPPRRPRPPRASSAAATSPGQSAAVAPHRLIPVSASRCSRARRPARRAAAAICADHRDRAGRQVDVRRPPPRRAGRQARPAGRAPAP